MQEPSEVPVFFFDFLLKSKGMTITSQPVEYVFENYLWGSDRNDVSVSAALSHRGPVLDVVFSVQEKELRRMVWEDGGPVWMDSCVEIFIMGREGEYSNFEISASGAMLACHGTSRSGRVPYSDEVINSVKRRVEILENNNKQSRYRVSVSLDLSILGLADAGSVRFNLYKCGDGLKRPHYLSLFPIDLERPDFHCPSFFQEAVLA